MPLQSKGPEGPVGLVAHCAKPNAGALLRQLAAELRACGAEVLLETDSAACAGEPGGISYAELGRRCHLLLVLGGDGTILKVVHELGENLRPILGINLGSLGFLTCISSGNAMDAVEAVCSGRYVLSRRSLLDVELEREGRVISRRNGLNEAVISRGGLSRLIKLDTWVNGIALTQFNADGLLVATPTGSTAYSLSAGGPVISPDARVFVITPVCPHVLTNRSLVVGDGSEIIVRPVGSQTDVLLTVDGHGVEKVCEGDIIRIRKSTLQFSLAMLPELSFCEVLREKLKWSGSAV
ncbi:MAG: NAD(+)/NADH kinase [Chthoniobacteraceae bacterium]|nr:NAD(+)/NADH kinase [Chthoniobacteraceae bacterium]